MLLLASALILPAAILSALAFDYQSLDNSQLKNFYLHYGNGYVHRGLIGTIIHVFNGGPPDEGWVRAFWPRFETFLNVSIMVLLWAAMAPRICLSFAGAQRNILLALLAAIMLSPMWRELLLHDGFMDEYMMFFILLAGVSAAVFRRPLPFFIFCCLAVLAHRAGMLFFAVLVLLILHAMLVSEGFRRRWQQWSAAMLAAVLFCAATTAFNDSDQVLELLRQSKSEYIINNDVANYDDYEMVYHTPWQHIFPIMMAAYAHATGFVAISLLVFCSVPIAICLLLPWLAKNHRPRLLSGRGLRAYWLLPPTVIAITLSINLVAFDWSRFLYWIWFTAALLLLHHVWLLPASAAAPQAAGGRQNAAARWIVPVMALVSWIHAGSFYLTSYIKFPYAFQCRQYCIPGLTSHAAGSLYAQQAFDLLLSAAHPTDIDLEKESLSRHFISSHCRLGRTADGLRIAAKCTGDDGRHLLNSNRIFWPRESRMLLALSHSYSRQAAFSLEINGQPVAPSHLSPQRTVWALALPAGESSWHLVALPQDEGFVLKRLYLDIDDRD